MYILLPAVYGDSECVNVCWGHQDIAKLNMIGYWEILFGFSYWYAYGDSSSYLLKLSKSFEFGITKHKSLCKK